MIPGTEDILARFLTPIFDDPLLMTRAQLLGLVDRQDDLIGGFEEFQDVLDDSNIGDGDCLKETIEAADKFEKVQEFGNDLCTSLGMVLVSIQELEHSGTAEKYRENLVGIVSEIESMQADITEKL